MASEILQHDETIHSQESGRIATDSYGPLLPPEGVDSFRALWHEIQVNFVDEPRESVQRADELVADVIQRISNVFAEERAKLESGWQDGGTPSTESLRVALQHYRSFFDRLLST